MKWSVLSKVKSKKNVSQDFVGQNAKVESSGEIIKILLENRGLKAKKEIADFLTPASPENLTAKDIDINVVDLKKAIARIRSSIKKEEPIVVYGDYDADGICATAIMWETLRNLGAQVMPFIPLREKEGYGLSKEGIDTITHDPRYKIQDTNKETRKQKQGLIITVDSGIVAHKAVEYAKAKGLDVIILDHHEKPQKLPRAFTIVHTLQLCASGVAFFVSTILKKNDSLKESFFNNLLELAAIATVTDLVPLIGPNRSIVKYGLELLNKTTRPGLRALFEVAGIEKVGTYEIGFMIGPRLNASGRIENALTALRLLCTRDSNKARELATLLNSTNRDRQLMLEEQTLNALNSYERRATSHERIIIVEHESYHQGVIGLIAGRLVEKYYLPAIVIAKGETLSKASARSISGFNIIEAIRQTDELLINAGGHPMAAGFTIETNKISEFKTQISELAAKKISPEMLQKTLRIDCELSLQEINMDLYKDLARLAPFGLGNPEPVFCSQVTVQSFRTVGAEGKHLKLTVAVSLSLITGSSPVASDKFTSDNVVFDAIAFNMGHLASNLKIGQEIELAYNLDLNIFNGSQTLQLKVKDIKIPEV